jgi:hypothetical protein
MQLPTHHTVSRPPKTSSDLVRVHTRKSPIATGWRRFREANRGFLLSFGSVTVSIAILSILYLIYGAETIRTAYYHNSFSVLNVLASDQVRHSLQFYLDRANQLFWVNFAFGVPLSLLFYWTLFKSVKSLLRHVDN